MERVCLRGSGLNHLRSETLDDFAGAVNDVGGQRVVSGFGVVDRWI